MERHTVKKQWLKGGSSNYVLLERHCYYGKGLPDSTTIYLELHDGCNTVHLGWDNKEVRKLLSDIQTIRKHLDLLEKWASEIETEKRKRDKSDANENTISG